MIYISRYSGEEIDNLLSNSSKIDGLETEINNLENTDNSLSERIAAAETKLNTTFSTNKALVSDGSGQISASSITSTQLGYLNGVTSAIQTQLNNKAPAYTYSTTDLTAGSSSLATGQLYIVYE